MSQENVCQVVEWKVYSSDICGKRYEALFRICIVMEREIEARTKNRNWIKNKNWKGNRNIQWQVFKRSCSKNWPKFRVSYATVYVSDIFFDKTVFQPTAFLHAIFSHKCYLFPYSFRSERNCLNFCRCSRKLAVVFTDMFEST